MKLFKQVAILFLCSLLVQFNAQAGPSGSPGQSNGQAPASAARLSPKELQQLVAPIALYPDALVAQVLATRLIVLSSVHGLFPPRGGTCEGDRSRQ